MQIRFSRRVALVVGLLLPCIETWRRWGDFARWASWLDDIIAGALLLYAWQAGRTDEQSSRPYLMAAWGYVVGIAYMSFFGQLEQLDQADPSGVPVVGVLTFKGVGLVLSALCLAFAWRSPASTR